MNHNYKKLGPYIKSIDVRNVDGVRENLLGVSVNKKFISSIANTNGTDFTKYKIVQRGQFTYIPDTSRRGDKIAIALLQDCEKGLVSNVYTVFEVIDSNKLLPEYLMMWFMRPEFDRYARYMSTGSVREIFSWDDMCNVELPIPSIDKQKEIITSYNIVKDRIKNLDSLIENLSLYAILKYEKYFVEKECNSKLSDLCAYSKDKIKVSKLDIRHYFSTENLLQGKKGATIATGLPATENTTACKMGDVLISNIRPYFKKILFCEDDCGCSTDVLCFHPSSISLKWYLFCTLYRDSFFDYVMTGCKGTKMPRGDKKHIMEYPVYIPDENELNSFNSIIEPIMHYVFIIKKEREILNCLEALVLKEL